MQRTSQNRRSSIQTVSQRKTNSVDRTTRTFHLARVRECASVRTDNWYFHTRVLGFGYWKFRLSFFCRNAVQFGRGTHNFVTSETKMSDHKASWHWSRKLHYKLDSYSNPFVTSGTYRSHLKRVFFKSAGLTVSQCAMLRSSIAHSIICTRLFRGKIHSDWFNGIEILQGRWQHGEKVGYC